MRALDRKLLRELRGMAGQLATIALVVASGITSLVALQGTWSSLVYSRDQYYERYRFGDVFVALERAPSSGAQSAFVQSPRAARPS